MNCCRLGWGGVECCACTRTAPAARSTSAQGHALQQQGQSTLCGRGCARSKPGGRKFRFGLGLGSWREASEEHRARAAVSITVRQHPLGLTPPPAIAGPELDPEDEDRQELPLSSAHVIDAMPAYTTDPTQVGSVPELVSASTASVPVPARTCLFSISHDILGVR
ncbi:hypothetical protein B0H14DRAFT_2627661 [Mycena olivaceomarginata]|nr:hypothetical protein B0H14DRAFT_2627661 [Mycena olivaceomarginata]